MRAPSILVVLGLVLAFSTACTGQTAESGDPHAEESAIGQQQNLPQADLLEPVVHPDATTGLLEVRFRYADQTSMYAEGARHYLQVSKPDGTIVLRRDEGTEQGPGAGYVDSVQLEAGRYRVQTYQRGCDYTQLGDCERVVDPPTGRCTAEVVIRASATTMVDITVPLPEPCSLEVTSTD